ncbi:MAG TPA: tetratricopeptide repeat protein [Caulobacteraceae bacterium]|nr:tetratricopeptide repeat protein [Caulobacteraceae bacterium]
MKWLPAFAAAATVAIALPAGGAITVIGDNAAAVCARAVALGLADDDSLRLCNDAVEHGDLNHHDLVATYVNRGAVLMNRRDYAAADADFERAIRMEPAAGEAWMDRGAIAILQHRFRDGIADTTKGIALGVEDPAKAYFNRAVAYEGVDDEKSAYFDYQQALTLKPGWDLPRRELLRFSVTVREGGAG